MKDKVPSSNVGARAAQLNRWTAMRIASTMLVVLLSASASGAASDEVVLDFAPVADGAKYKEALVALIRKSDRIVVTEHSDPFDLFDAVAGESKIPEPIVYGERELTVAQQEFFSITIERLDPKTQDTFSSCIPSVHHTFYFYSGDQLTDKIDVCFQCSQVIWPSNKVVPPWSLYPGLKRVLVAFGLQPRRDWPKLARDSLK